MERAAENIYTHPMPRSGASSWLRKIDIPSYYKGEDLFNAMSHLLGAALSLFALAWLLRELVLAAAPMNEVLGMVIYCASLIVLYTTSGIYHLLPRSNAKRIFRVMDHCTIYLLIAGCYTPVALVAFWGYWFAPVILAVEWGLALIGIIANTVNMTAMPVKIFSMISYLVMGWMALLIPSDLLMQVGQSWFPWILAGGVAYTVGIVFYAIGSKRHYSHCIWHIFVLAGSILQFAGFIQMI